MTQFRIKRMQMTGISIGIFHKKTPWMAAWWSAALPGLGHICLGEYFKGFILLTWEAYVNTKAHVNMAILYTFTGDFQAAHDVIDEGWALVYVSIFCFAIFDGYRMTIELNTYADLERKQKNRQFQFAKYSIWGVNYLSHKNPWAAAGWSALFAGFGHIYNMKTLKGIILLGWLVVIIHLSHFPQGVIYTLTGRFEETRNLVDYHWLMFFPSIYVFGIWDAYNDAVEMNKLFEEAFKGHLRERFSGGKKAHKFSIGGNN